MNAVTLNASSKARIALFNREAKQDDDPATTYPLMTGFIENSDFKIGVSAFLKINTNTGKKFLSLVIRNQHDEQTFQGTLHRSDKAGKEDTYFGYISEQFLDMDEQGEKVYSNSEWQLGISAKIKTPEGKKKHIGGDVYALRAKANTAANPEQEDELAF